MLFEKQQYQEDCVRNILAILQDEKIDFDNSCFSQLAKVVTDYQSKHQVKGNFVTSVKSCLDILMETGTGKTFTYLKTIFELNKQFGKSKFVIVVPRSAIRLGVIQNIKLTKEYFFNEYGKHLNFIDYPNDGIAKIQQSFINSKDLSVLLTTNSAFNKDSEPKKDKKGKVKNIIHQKSENLFKFGSTWEGIAQQKPVVIIDEPHLLKGSETQKGLDKLNQSLFIRFGATFPQEVDVALSNVIYCLDSISAFNDYLVKKIRVHTIFTDGEQGQYKLTSIEAKKKQFTLAYFRNGANYTTEIGLKEDIGEKTGIIFFKGVYATKLTTKEISLSNEEKLAIKNDFNLSDQETQTLIEKTIEKHFEKEEKLFQKGIKTLSLFFIPSVKDFRKSQSNPTPRIKRIFEQAYKEQRQKVLATTCNKEYKQFLEKDFCDGKLKVHQGYFSGDKGTNDNKESEGVNLILNKKEELLSLKTPLRFVFSVWALQEGWDNPNIFNICKLSSTDKETSKRQQVGRGLRIAVNGQGRRQTFKYLQEDEQAFYDINSLDMFVSHQELDFIGSIQQEIQAASFSLVGDYITNELLKEKGLNDREVSRLLNLLEDEKIIEFIENEDKFKIKASIYDFLNSNEDKLDFFQDKERLQEIKNIFKSNKFSVENANKKVRKVGIRAEQLAKFKQLWETINRKSKIVYQNLNDEEIIKAVAERFNKLDIPPIAIKVVSKRYDSQTNQIITEKEDPLNKRANFFEKSGLEDFLAPFIKDEKIKMPLAFLIKLFNALDKQKIVNNPAKARRELRDILLETIHNSIIQKIDYKFENEVKITSLQDEQGEYLKEVRHTLLGGHISSETAKENLLYDTICYDSKIEEEIQIEDSEQVKEDKITVMAKLPKIAIPTPFKTYNPDFAYLIDKKDGKQLFLIVETKGYESEGDIPIEQRGKIEYAKKFFAKLQREMPQVEIAFKTRINQQSLGDLLREIRG